MSALRWPAWADGRLVAPGAPALAADDAGFLHGLAVYDTVFVERGAPVALEAHLARLADAARALGIGPPPHEPARALAELVRALDERGAPARVLVRLTLARGAPGAGTTLVATARPWREPPAAGADVVLAQRRRVAGDPLARYKLAARPDLALARERARAVGADEALVLASEGDVLEGTVTNVFVLCDGALVTPPVERGCLPGIVRAQVLALARSEPPPGVRAVAEESVPIGLLERCDELWLSGTGGPLTAVRRVRGVRERLPGPAGAAFAALAGRLRAARAAGRGSGESERAARHGRSAD